jgi:ubiquinone/menaquinone biosynthesis C-methylase UbiE
MKMGRVEKLFVNNDGHSQGVGRYAEKLLRSMDFEAGGKYLDVGCGNGAAPIHIAQTFGLDVTGIDVDPEQIEAAQARGQGIDNARFMTMDSTQLPFSEGEFDIIFTNKVTHHIPNWQDAMAEMVRVLKPGGYLIYSDFVLPGPVAALGRSIAGNRVGFPTRAALKNIVERHDLSVVNASGSALNYQGVFQKRAS